VSEQRNNQSDFSFELEGLSAKFAGMKDDIKKKKTIIRNLYLERASLHRTKLKKKLAKAIA